MESTTNPFRYLDNAATSWPKPPAVLAAMNSFYQDLGVAAERSGSARAGAVDREADRGRARRHHRGGLRGGGRHRLPGAAADRCPRDPHERLSGTSQLIG